MFLKTLLGNFVFFLFEKFTLFASVFSLKTLNNTKLPVKKAHLKIIILILILISSRAYSQFLPSLALAGGTSVGWHFNPTDDLNNELRNAGFPEVSKNGFFTLGGGGFIDLPLKKNFLRIGGMGIGFNSNVSKQVNDTLSKAVNYAFGMGGISLEFVKVIGRVDLTIGAMFSTGTLKLDLYQYGKSYGNYGGIIGEYINNSSSNNITRNFRVRFYAVHPQVGIGVLVTKFAYLKLDAGYLLAAQGTWKVDNDVEVTNFPSGIKANGFTLNLGVNFGIFFRD